MKHTLLERQRWTCMLCLSIGEMFDSERVLATNMHRHIVAAKHQSFGSAICGTVIAFLYRSGTPVLWLPGK